MNGLIKYVLHRPVVAAVCILRLIFFGYSSVTGTPLGLSPDMGMSTLMAMATYSGVSPEDIDELVIKETEDQVSPSSSLKSITSSFSEGSSMVMLECEHGTDTGEAYDNLKKEIDLASSQLPDGADTPTVIEMSMNSQPSITPSIDNPEEDSLYTYVGDEIVPEFERISVVAGVNLRGGTEDYVKVGLTPEKVSQYKMTMSSIVSDIKMVDLSYPAGGMRIESQKLSVPTCLTYDTVELLKKVPLTTQDGNAVYLEDVTNMYITTEDSDSITRYDGQETASISITKQQSTTSVGLSDEVRKVTETLTMGNESLNIVTVSDPVDSIMESLLSTAEALILVAVVSMAVIWLFFGNIKASLIVGSFTSIPILTALTLINLMGFTLNVVTTSASILRVDMMVDNSIVVLEGYFRTTDKKRGGFTEYLENALKGIDVAWASISGGTATTCAVFLPLAFLKGMTGQVFKPLGFTTVFCMATSLAATVTVVPLCYMMYKPRERENAPLSGPVVHMQEGYRILMKKFLHRKRTVLGISLGLLAFSLLTATKLDMELMASNDQGEVNISVGTRPGFITERVGAVLQEIKQMIVQNPSLESYVTSYGGNSLMDGGSVNIAAYLRDNRDMSMSEVANLWKQELSEIKNCDITVDVNFSASMMSSFEESYEVVLEGADYDAMKGVLSSIVSELVGRDDVTKIHSDIENSSPVVEVRVNALKTQSTGLTTSAIGSTVSSLIDDVKVTEIGVDGEDIKIGVEYTDDEYKTIDQVKGIVLTTSNGGSMALTDLADIRLVDSPATISREGKQYLVTITGEYTEQANRDTENQIKNQVAIPNLTSTVTIRLNSMDQSMNKEFSALFGTIGTVVFLVFVVMAAQLESPKYSSMIMATISFSLIGASGLLYPTNCKVGMVSLIELPMLIGMVVNNGILLVDMVNQYRNEMDTDTTLAEAGATRIRPTLMTTLITVLSMISVAMALGNSGSMTQGPAVVDIDGLTVSTTLCFLMPPVCYRIASGETKQESETRNGVER